jgi:hypothetical protein
METEPPDNRGLIALLLGSGGAGFVLVLAGDGGRAYIFALVAFACFIVAVALLGLSSVLRQHERWREWHRRQRLTDHEG